VIRWPKRVAGTTKSKTVVVLGMHRSGTSVVAAVLRRLGVHIGDQLLGAHKDNPTGHHEALDMLELNDRILHSAGGNWLSPPSRAAILRQRRAFRSEIASLAWERNRRHKVWGWKDPRTALTVELFLPHLRNPRLVVVHRSPHEVARSLSARDGTDFEANMRLCRLYFERMEIALRRSRAPRLEVHYERLRMDPRGEVERLARFLGRELTSEELDSCAALVLDDDGLQVARARFGAGEP
jgi:hypothetical protein